MTNTWVQYRRLGKFLCKLDVIEYETLQEYLKTMKWQVFEWKQGYTNIYAWHNPGYEPGSDITTMIGIPMFDNEKTGQHLYMNENMYMNFIKFMCKLDIIRPEHTMANESGEYNR